MSNSNRCLDGCKQWEESEEITGLNTDRLNLMLTFLLERLFDDDEFLQFTGVPKGIIFGTMTLDLVKEKVTLKKYQTTVEFMDDIRLISSGQKYSPDFNANEKKSLRNLIAFCNQEINDISSCDHCYENATKEDEWFSMDCPRRHPLAWAKVMGHPYAPAKVMKYKATEKSYVVYFFGDHETAIIPSHYCLGFSEESPNKIISLQQREHLNDTMKEVAVYIENLKKNGSFSYAAHSEKFDLHSLVPRSKPNITICTSSPNATNDVTVPTVTLARASYPNETSSMSIVNMENNTNCVTTTVPNARSVSYSNDNNTIAEKKKDSSIPKAIVAEPCSINQDARDVLNKLLDQKDVQLETLKKQLIAEKKKHFQELKRVRDDTEKIIRDIKKKTWCSDCQKELNYLNFCGTNCSSKRYN